MAKTLRSMALLSLAASLLVSPVQNVFGQDQLDAGTVATDKGAEEIEDKLLKLTTLEDAFLKAARTRNLLRRYLIEQNSQLQQTENEDEKQALTENIENVRTRLQTINIAMDVVFGIGQRREYEYNQVTSTVYLKVGTVAEAFARAVNTRDALRKFVQEQQALLDGSTDEAEKEESQNRIDAGTRQYQTLVAALQLVFGITPQRNYMYNPSNATLYLKITEGEMEKLRLQLEELQAKQQAEKEAEG